MAPRKNSQKRSSEYSDTSESEQGDEAVSPVKPGPSKRNQSASKKVSRKRKNTVQRQASHVANAATVLMQAASKQSRYCGPAVVVRKRAGTRPSDPQGWVQRAFTIMEEGQDETLILADGTIITDDNFKLV
jgi:hypothetical protein